MREKEIIRQIHGYCNGELTVEEGDRLWEELIREPRYMKLLEAEIAARNYFRKQQENPNKRQKNSSNVRHGGIGEQLNHESDSSPFSYGSGVWVAGSAVVILLVALVQFFSAEQKPMVSDHLVTAISIEEMVTPQLLRSGGDEQTYHQLDVEITRGFKLAISGQEGESLEKFEEIIASELSSENRSYQAMANLNYGILLYNQGRYEEASTAFENVTEMEPELIGSALASKGWWYLGQSNIRLNSYTQARQAILHAIKHNKGFEQEASQLLPGLEIKIARKQ